MEGVGELFLSDVLDTNHFKKGVFNLIDAPCGSGKTTAAIEKIAPLASTFDRAIYLIDTKLGKDRLATEEKLTIPYKEYADDVSRHFFALENEGKLCVTTYAQFGYWCYRFGLEFPDYFEYIICDEPQNLVTFSEYGTKDKTDIPVHQSARLAISRAVWTEKSYVIGITATPAPLEKMKLPMYPIPIDRTDLHHYVERNTINFANLDSIMGSLSVGMRGGLYIKHVQPMLRIGDQFRVRGFNPLLLWSLNYKEKPLTEDQLRARKHIIENEAVPDEYDVFLFNATAETSINLRSHMDFFIAYNTSETSITQSRGRYRGDLDTLYIYKPKSLVVVPDSYLNRPLTRDDLKILRAHLGLKKDEKGHALSIDDMLRMFSDCGYNVEKGIRNRRDSFIIRKA